MSTAMRGKDASALSIARKHLAEWTNHDLEGARANLAVGVQFISANATLSGIDQYMDGPGGLASFAKQVVPGSLRVKAERGDQRRALLMYEVDIEGGPMGSMTVPSAELFELDESGKITTDRILFYATPRVGKT